MTIEGKAVLVTGANRGIGHALVEEAFSRAAKAGLRGRALSQIASPLNPN